MQVEQLLLDNKVQYFKSGRDFKVKCLNPEHEDTNPSMRVDSVTGIFNCFSCGFKGNLFYHFGEAPVGLGIERELLKEKIKKKMPKPYNTIMPNTYQEFNREYRNISARTFKEFEAFTSMDFPDRLMFPIRTLSGSIEVLIGRAMGLTEYKNKYQFYPKHTSPPMFPLQKITGNKPVILVEGIFDLLNLYDKGLSNVLCVWGTSTVNEQKLSTLHIMGVQNLQIFFDGDDAGQTAASKVKELAERMHFSVKNICFKNKDPGELTETQVIKLREKLA